MNSMRRAILAALPKVLISRLTGLAARLPLPHRLRPLVYGWYARRYGVDLQEMQGEASEHDCLASFFQRSLVEGARPIAADSEFVCPCDGRIVSSGLVSGKRLLQVKGRDYSLSQLLQNQELARLLAGGYQATIYLAPGDYHRVHSPFAGEIVGLWHLPGCLFPVNKAAVDSIPDLFPRNERLVFRYRLERKGKDVAAAVVMISALNVGNTHLSRQLGPVAKGEEIGRFGMGSTVVVLVAREGPEIPDLPPETAVRMGQALAGSAEPDPLASGQAP